MRAARLFSLPILGAVLAGIAAISVAPAPAEAAQTVSFREDYMPGTVVIKYGQRRLYYVVGGGRAIAYPVGVGRAGKAWFGTRYIDGKRLKPAWSPPAEVKRDKPSLPNVIPGGSPRNPMGVAAMTLDRDEIAIHGTTSRMRASIGSRASYGCIRMLNEDVADLYGRVDVGANVVMQP